jgi:hypothetical protein
MAVTINGDGTISGVSVGGLPDGVVDSGTLATGIDATKLADGTITNSELQYINSLSSNAQTQISAVGGGKVLQIVSNNTGITTNINTTASTDLRFDVSITPTSALSKILVFGTFAMAQDDGPAGSAAVALIYKNDTTALEELTIGYEASEAAPSFTAFALSALDGPVGSTSTIKYSIYGRTSNSASQFRFSSTAGTFWAIEFDPS